MRWILAILFGAWILGAIFVTGLRFWRQWRGRRLCRQWACPKCQLAFGESAEVKQWERRKDIGMKSALFSGPVMHCARCAQDYWFTWAGHLLDAGMRGGFQVVASRWTWDA
jgi:hypothetical protein